MAFRFKTVKRSKATQAPSDNAYGRPARPEIGFFVLFGPTGWIPDEERSSNAAFIAVARTAIPELLADARRLREAVREKDRQLLAQAHRIAQQSECLAVKDAEVASLRRWAAAPTYGPDGTPLVPAGPPTRTTPSAG